MEKLQTMIMLFWGGRGEGGVKELYYGISAGCKYIKNLDHLRGATPEDTRGKHLTFPRVRQVAVASANGKLFKLNLKIGHCTAVSRVTQQ